MSYILDALKKSDQQRQRGATPTLPTAHVSVSASRKSFSVYYGVLAAVLLCAGIAIGWMHPWQAEPAAHAAAPVAISNTSEVAPTPPADPVAMEGKSEQKLPEPSQTSATAVASSMEPIRAAAADQVQKTTALADLPPAIQQEIPAMTIQLHSYSSKSANSIVSINSRMLKEGDSLSPGLKLEQITPDGVILSYKGYRFQRGIH